MFEPFYEFQQTPFSRDIPTDQLYDSDTMQEMLGRLTYAAERRLFAVVTGGCGTGKTTTIRRFAATLNQSKHKVLYMSDSKLTPRNFYKGLLGQLGFESKFYRGDAKRQLHREIELMRELQKVHPVVIVDESHLLDREMLEEVRFLMNMEMDAKSPMALILVGQTELAERLQMQSYAAIRQRIDVQCKMTNYDRAQTGEYIRKHVINAGCEREIFTEQAMDEIFRFSSGTARLINKTCIHSLIHGAQHRQRLIDDHIVKRIVQGELS
jgi:type II secretory pathway predicted ATPase ExeA